MPNIRVVGFDGDDTLWHNEHIFLAIEQKFSGILEPYLDAADISTKLYETEKRNLARFGYGAKGFVLSMLETAIDLTEARITGQDVSRILQFMNDILDHPLRLIEGARDALRDLAGDFQLVLITKGELLHQENKIANSGLAEHFRHIRIVSEKHPDMYKALLEPLGAAPDEFVMVGNSLRSDVQPALQFGAFAIHVPYQVTWQHEVVDADNLAPGRWWQAASIREVPQLIRKLGNR